MKVDLRAEAEIRATCPHRARDLNGSCDLINDELGWTSQTPLSVCRACLTAGGPKRKESEAPRRDHVRKVLLTVERTLPAQSPEVRFEFLRNHADPEKRIRLGYSSEAPEKPDREPERPEWIDEWAWEWVRRNPCNVARFVKAVGRSKFDRAFPEIAAVLAYGQKQARERIDSAARQWDRVESSISLCARC